MHIPAEHDQAFRADLASKGLSVHRTAKKDQNSTNTNWYMIDVKAAGSP
jgi:hypothetical protein